MLVAEFLPVALGEVELAGGEGSDDVLGRRGLAHRQQAQILRRPPRGEEGGVHALPHLGEVGGDLLGAGHGATPKAGGGYPDKASSARRSARTSARGKPTTLVNEPRTSLTKLPAIP